MSKSGRFSRLILILLLLAASLSLRSITEAAAADKITASSAYSPLPGLDIRVVTELSRAGWLRYAVIAVDMMSGDFYVGPYVATGFLDKPSTTIEALRKGNLLAAVNGDFFDTATGMPLSMTVADGSLIRSPRKDNDFTTICTVNSLMPYMQSFSWSAKLISPVGATISISAYNELSVGQSDAVLYNAMRSDRKYPKGASVLLLKGGFIVGRYVADHAGRLPAEALALPFDFEVVATGDKAKIAATFAAGDAVALEFGLSPSYAMESAFSGKPVLVRNGMKVDGLSRFTEISGGFRAPRTMAGITRDGKLLLVAVEGRGIDSRGVTLDEAALLMMELGCREALNLDGGGSTQAAASDGGYAMSLLATPARKVPYSVGVSSRAGLLPQNPAPLDAAPVFGAPFLLPPVGLPSEPGGAYSWLVPELPVISVGTVLYFATEADAAPKLRVVTGAGSVEKGEQGLIATSPGYVELESLYEGSIVGRYRFLVAGEPATAHFTSVIQTDDGLSFAIEAYDASGRQIPLPSAGLRLLVSTTDRQFELPAPLIPKSELKGLAGIIDADLLYGDLLLDRLSIQTGTEEDGAELAGFGDESFWQSYGSPAEAAEGVSFKDTPYGRAAEVRYDFTGSGVRAAYLKPAEMIPIPEGSRELWITVDSSLAEGHWLRANVRDPASNRHFLDFGRLTGEGWQQYEAALPEGGPFSLEQVYLVEFKDEIRSKGAFLLADLRAAGSEGPGRFSLPDRFEEAGTGPTYSKAQTDSLGLSSRIIASFGTSAVPGSAKVVKLDFTGGSAFVNGIAQMQRLYEACTVPGKAGALIIQVVGSKAQPKEGSYPLFWAKDSNERQLILALAERAAFMGYSEVIVIEGGSEAALTARRGGALFLALPGKVE